MSNKIVSITEWMAGEKCEYCQAHEIYFRGCCIGCGSGLVLPDEEVQIKPWPSAPNPAGESRSSLLHAPSYDARDQMAELNAASMQIEMLGVSREESMKMVGLPIRRGLVNTSIVESGGGGGS